MIEGFKKIYINNEFGIGFIISQLFFVFILNYILNQYNFRDKNQRKYKIIELSISLIYMFIISCLFAGYLNLPYFSAPFTIIDIIMFSYSFTLVAYNIFILKMKPSKQITTSLLFYCLYITQSNFAGWLGICKDYVWNLNIDINFTLIFNLLGMICITLLMIKFNFKKFTFIPWIMVVLVVGYFLFSMICFSTFRIYFLKYCRDNCSEVFILIFISFIILSILVYLMIYYNAKEYNEKMMDQLIIDNNKNYIQMMQMSEDKYKTIRKINHDVKNQFMMLKVLSDEKKFNELNEYINNYLKNNSIVDSLSHCGNKVIDDILNIEFSKCKKENIDLDTKIIVPPTLNINPVDLCSLIMNIVDNALNEVKKIEKKKIYLEIQLVNTALLIKTENETKIKFSRNDLNNLLLKNNGDNYHGWGLKIVQNIVDKYKGSIKLECDDNFVVTIMIFNEV